MTRNRRMTLILLLLTALLLACGRFLPISQVTPIPSAPPLSLPTSTLPAPTSLPTPLPDQGPLPRVLTEVDFGLATGDGYEPQAVALDETQGLAAVLNYYHEATPQSCVSIVDVQRGQVIDTVPLPWSSIGPLVIGGGRIYIRHEENGKDYLSAVDVTTHQVVATVTTDFLYYGNPLIVDPDAGRLYAIFSDHLEARATADLALLGSFPFTPAPGEIGLALDADADRLYLSLGEQVMVIQASTLRQVNTFNHSQEAPLKACFLDTAGERLYVQGSTAILVLDADTGQMLARLVPEIGDYWRLLGIDGAGQPYVYYSQETTSWLAVLDPASGEPINQTAARYDDRFVMDMKRRTLITAHYANHILDLRDVPQLSVRQEIPLGIELLDLVIDHDAGRLYVSDNTGRVHVLDAADYHEIATLSGRGQLILDAANHRLYVAEDYGPQVTVLDTEALAVAGTIPEGGYIAVDSAGGRVFVGHQIDYGGPRPGDAGVRVFDANTLQQTATLSQPGIPTYNPVADEVYVLNYTAYAFDGQIFDFLGELTPDIGAQEFKWCNGCDKVTAIHVHPDRQVIVVELTTLSAGKGAGFYPPSRFFDAATRAPLESPAITVQHTCWDTPVLIGPIDGRTYETVEYSRYMFYDNLIVRDATTGQVQTWLDGITAGLLNPVTRQAYVPRWPEILVLDLSTLTPLGHIPYYCFHTLDPTHDRLYAMGRALLTALTNRGAAPTLPPPAEAVIQLPSIDSIVLSPNYATDRTIFVTGGGGVFRSTDGGANWQQLHGGLPHDRYYDYYAPVISLALSPDFATDHTMFAGIFIGDSMGYGVYRSTDGGDTWRPTWSGLTHLRVHKITVSPDFATDRTVVAHGRYQNLSEWAAGQSLFRSTDGGQTWEMIASGTQSDGGDLPPLEEILPALDKPVRFRSGGYGQLIERTTDGGDTWQIVFTLSPGEYPLEIVTSPSFEQDHSVYVLFYTSLLRTTDGGQTWQSFQDPALAREDDSDTWLTALALAPADGGGHTLFLGRNDGQFIVRESEALAWQPATSAPTPTPFPSPGPTAVSSPSPTPTPCTLDPADVFVAAYPQATDCLGCAVGSAAEITLGEQAFERGRMFWREDQRVIYALFADGTWLSFPDTYSDDQPPDDPTLTPPPSRQQPIRGFGKVWREQLGGPDAAIGWATEGERGYQGWWQPFGGGLMLTGSDGTVYALCADGTWR